MNDLVLQCIDLKKHYGEGDITVEVLQGVQLQVKRGETLAIVGSSGSGKSTLLNMLGGLDLPSSGDVRVDDRSLFEINEQARAKLRNRSLGFVYQFHHLLPEFSALENVAMPLLIRGEAISAVREQSAAILDSVGLSHRLEHKPSMLSGGERQRVAIARALVTNPACVLMDEPTGNLDRHTGQDVQSLMNRLNSEFGISFVVVTHDLELAKKQGRVVELKDGLLQPITL
ncbi:lipoprotein-releasing ABC transporter ATP-binding protein LolD [Amphritea sp. 2_MG-2023]|jgi:lipoprotein-releasing system ATP-binding protein|uniref:lipoprotein-releasing ABC transporter ATP-binding protein LolD n=1 Tax=Amphritea TaxID=515417 RepID=UPI001C074F89|nr:MULTISPECIES: lipoprotein-releasing ABC transporter ATP-binding protein LolD [Amphritea]MBU2966550.1 lipoprotein-releasing ABC transporter ATP-binding protein LolD [Amphritea atlantica]MDO6417591.1 lipoprotein-releasing ABC transporter ATP-binding protein LolD [Amphritea sp. 2_MG-2023]MDX2423618.1 lipoprotein-releasing ABC transporter ATP-binding protein LolD [Amphritea sp.]